MDPEADSPDSIDKPVADSHEGINRFHQELFGIARRELRRRVRSGTIDTVALVNEAYLRAHDAAAHWQSRAHFLASMTTVMRHVLVDYARERGAQRRGGDWLQVTGSQLNRVEGKSMSLDMLALDKALSDLGQISGRLERVMELRLFSGMTAAEISQALDISTATVVRELRKATAFLSQAMDSG